MCVWAKKRGSMKAEVLMATPCPKSLGDGEYGAKDSRRGVARKVWMDSSKEPVLHKI